MNREMPQSIEGTDVEYDQLAPTWETSIRAYPFRMEVMYPNIIEGLGIRGKNQRVLDLACGTGYLTNAIGESAEVFGVDKNEQMLKEARRLYPNTRFVRADIQKLPLENDSIDAISASCAYHYANDLKQLSEMLRESARVLRPGGRISGVLVDPNHPISEWVPGSVRSAEWLGEPYTQGAKISVGVHDPKTGAKLDTFTVFYYSSEDYAQAFRDAGLEFSWQEYSPPAEFMRRPNARELTNAVQVKLFTAIKK